MRKDLEGRADDAAEAGVSMGRVPLGCAAAAAGEPAVRGPAASRLLRLRPAPAEAMQHYTSGLQLLPMASRARSKSYGISQRTGSMCHKVQQYRWRHCRQQTTEPEASICRNSASGMCHKLSQCYDMIRLHTQQDCC